MSLRLRQLSKEQREQIATAYAAGQSIFAICRLHNISHYTFQNLRKEDKLDEVKQKIGMALAELQPEELEVVKKSMKRMGLSILRDLFDMWMLKRSELQPRNLTELVGPLTKLIETLSKISDDGDRIPEAIEIRVTGINPAAPPAIVTQLVEDGSVVDTPAIPAGVPSDKGTSFADGVPSG